MGKKEITYTSPTWEEMGQLCFELAKKIIASEEKFDRLITFAKGGWTWSRTLADYLKLKKVASIQIVSYKGIYDTERPIIHQSLPVNIAGEKILLFDDINDTGATLKTGIDYLNICGAEEVTTSVLYHKPWSEKKPDFIGRTTESWIIFPHEIREMISLLNKKWQEKGLTKKEIESKIKNLKLPSDQIKYFFKFGGKMSKPVTDLKYQNITISGLPGAGSTTLARGIVSKLNWNHFEGGDFMRRYAIKKGLFDPENGFHHDATVYDDEFDRKVDYGMRKTLKNEKQNILDSWLSGFMAQNISGVLKILVYCSDSGVKVDRIANRDDLSIEEAKEHIFERTDKNLKKWRRLYAREWKEWVIDKDKVPSGKPIYFWYPELYDMQIDTYSHGQEQTLNLVLDKLGYNK